MKTKEEVIDDFVKKTGLSKKAVEFLYDDLMEEEWESNVANVVMNGTLRVYISLYHVLHAYKKSRTREVNKNV